jgi:NTP pyrophosphatase (non-canonical NTP hydrolase)
LDWTNVFTLYLEDERKRQKEKWGEQEHGGHAWVSILLEEVGEVAKAINEDNMREALIELEQVAAVACAMWEQIMDVDRIDLRPQFGKFKQGDING